MHVSQCVFYKHRFLDLDISCLMCAVRFMQINHVKCMPWKTYKCHVLIKLLKGKPSGPKYSIRVSMSSECSLLLFLVHFPEGF